MSRPFSGSAQALMMSLLTGQATHWQRAWVPLPLTSSVWQSVSGVLFAKILQPVWWCCRCPEPVVTVKKNTVYWLAHLVQEPGPAADKLWIDAVRTRYQMQTNSILPPEKDAILSQVFQDYVTLYEFYRKGRVNELNN
ncbi:hypothetical protein SRABI106_02635 [Rahnella aquatilis]|nr:hypothetical protein SRABI106_02635 [Rahnella aquatilis]